MSDDVLCHVMCSFFAVFYNGTWMLVDKGSSALVDCDVTFYAGVQHLMRWYRDDMIIYERFANFKPFIHPLYQVRECMYKVLISLLFSFLILIVKFS